MLRKPFAIGVFLLALAPSAYLAFTLRTMPHLGFYHDDGIYWTCAKSLAQGSGYRIASLPGEPYQTKYPPLYPALLAGIWKLNPDFPSNLPAATLLAWLLLPVYLATVWLFLRQYGFRGARGLVLLLVATLNPVAVVFSFSLMPELLFTALLLASVLIAERALEPGSSRWLPLLAGVCGALAYLTKSAAAPLLLIAPACFLWRRQFRAGRAVPELRCFPLRWPHGNGEVIAAPFSGPWDLGDAVLHKLPGLSDWLQRAAARSAAGGLGTTWTTFSHGRGQGAWDLQTFLMSSMASGAPGQRWAQ